MDLRLLQVTSLLKQNFRIPCLKQVHFFVPATRTYRDSSFKLKLTVVKVLVDIPILDSVNICWSENGGLWEKLPH